MTEGLYGWYNVRISQTLYNFPHNGESLLHLPGSDPIRIVWHNRSGNPNAEYNMNGVFFYQEKQLRMTHIYDYEFTSYRQIRTEKKYEIKENVSELPCYFIVLGLVNPPSGWNNFLTPSFTIWGRRSNVPGDYSGSSDDWSHSYCFNLAQNLCTYTYYYRGDGGE